MEGNERKGEKKGEKCDRKEDEEGKGGKRRREIRGEGS